MLHLSQPTKWMRSRIGETPKGKCDVPTVMEGKTGSRDKTGKEKMRGGQEKREKLRDGNFQEVEEKTGVDVGCF